LSHHVVVGVVDVGVAGVVDVVNFVAVAVLQSN